MEVKSQSFIPKCDIGSTTAGNGLGTFEKFDDFLNLIFDFFYQMPAPSPC